MARRRKIRHIGGSLKLPPVGTTSVAITASDASLSPGAGSFSVAFWFRPDQRPSRAGGTSTVIECPNGNYQTGWFVNHNGQTLGFYVKSAGGQVTYTLTDYLWHRYVLTADASTHTMTLYVDGVQAFQTTPSAWTGSLTSPATLSLGSGIEFANAICSLADVTYAVGTVWSANDAAADYYDGKSLPGVTHHWPLDDGAGSTARATLGGLPLTLSGGAAFSGDSPMIGRGVVRNYVPQSSRIDLSPWFMSAANPSAYTGQLPTGVPSMVVMTDSGGTSAHYAAMSTGTACPAGVQQIISFYAVKLAGSGNAFTIAPDSGNQSVVFDLAAGIATSASAGVLSWGIEPTNVSGVWRCHARFVGSVSASGGFYLHLTSGSTNYTANGQSVAIGGIMQEVCVPGQTTPSPYVATGATPLSVYALRDTRQNLARYSEDLSNAVYNQSAGTTALAGQPGVHSNTSATKLTITQSNAYKLQDISQATSQAVKGKTYCASAWLWTDTPGKTVALCLLTAADGVPLQTKAVTLTTTPTLYVVSGPIPSGANVGSGLEVGIDNRLNGRGGDGVGSGTVYVDGIQVEQSSQPCGYIKTTTVAANANGAPRSQAA